MAAMDTNHAPSAARMLRPAIHTKGLRKVYAIGSERVIALGTVDLVIPKGQICGILGTSGSGKSTLLNMLAGLEKPTKGAIMIHGKRVDKLSERQLALFRQKHFGFVFQSYNLLPTLTAVENVALPLAFKGVGRKKREKQAIALLKAVGLGDRLMHRPTQMSGGQQQRVGIARAFVAGPDVVFADEPTGNLDTKTTIEVMETMVNLTRSRNKTLLIVTHDLEIASYADRVVKISDGDIIEDSMVGRDGPIAPNSTDEATETEDIVHEA
jgi:putative ABC transport system ATP-binding protein